jgi:predicted metalloprotease with PDZ domain
VPLEQTLSSFAGSINAVTLSPGRQLRTAEEMSRLAPFVDAAVSIDPTNWDNTFISYYTYGAAIGLALDLSLRDRSNGRATLDTYMRALWARHGRPGQKEPGMVATPYTAADLKTVLGEVSGDRAFADSFFARYIQGHDVADYAALLARAGLLLRPRAPGGVWLGGATLTFAGGGARVAGEVAMGSPLYRAVADRDDLIVRLDGTALNSEEALTSVLQRHRPGDALALEGVRRSGEPFTGKVRLEADPRLEIVPLESTGGALTETQRQFRASWLGSQLAERRTKN